MYKMKKLKISYPYTEIIKSRETYFSKSNTLFSTIPNEINLKELGLMKIKNITPFVLREERNKNSKLSPYKIKEITLINAAYLLSTKKREGLENLSVQERKLDWLEKPIYTRRIYIGIRNGRKN